MKFDIKLPVVRNTIFTLMTILLFYVTSVYHLEPNVIGITWNPISGKLDGDTIAGYHVSVPWEFVSRIDTRPIRVCITSTANSYSCLLVSFDKKYWSDFVKVQGFGYWWWNNRFSYNSGYKEEYRGFKDLMRGYAYGNNKYKFITITTDYSTNTIEP